jgi:hypothetical protein
MKPSLSPRPLLVALAAAPLALAACRIYVDQPATTARPAAPAQTAASYSQPQPHHFVRRPPLPPGSGTVAAPLPPDTSALADSTNGTANGAAACFDTASSPTPADCSQVHLSGGCAGATYAQQKCAAYKQYFDSKVASDALACLGTLGSKVCDQSAANACGRTSLAKACVDRSLSALCGIATTKCNASTADCTSLLSGLNDDGKEKVAACIAGGCANGLPACVDGLLPAH